MLSQFCIRRPIFATVLSLIIVLAGFVALRVLPLSQYPNISPPTVRVSATYDGADAETIARTVAAPIEDQLSGSILFSGQRIGGGQCPAGLHGQVVLLLHAVHGSLFGRPGQCQSVEPEGLL